jgi:hypothetical protein
MRNWSFLERIAGIKCGVSEGRKRIARLYSVFGCRVEAEVNVVSLARRHLWLGNLDTTCINALLLRHCFHHSRFFTHVVQ